MTLVKKIRKLLRSALNSRGFEVVQLGFETSYPHTLKKLLEVAKIDTVVDVGANTGQFAELLRENGYNNTIISFEPLAGPWKIIKEKSQNDSKWVVPERTAIGDFVGSIEINVSGNSMSSSVLDMETAHSNAAPESAYIGKEETQITTIDEFYRTNSPLFNSGVFLKIDTQGYEMHVLKGAVKTLEKVALVETEISFTKLYEGQVLYKEVVDFMEIHGFQLWALFPIFSDKSSGRLLQADALFLKNKA